MNTPVSFEIAKLLKERGYEQYIGVGTICRITNKVNIGYEVTRPVTATDLDNEWAVFGEVYPTIAEVVMWLYNKHGIWIEVRRSYLLNQFVAVTKNPRVELSSKDSPIEAYEAAIEYTLKNLI